MSDRQRKRTSDNAFGITGGEADNKNSRNNDRTHESRKRPLPRDDSVGQDNWGESKAAKIMKLMGFREGHGLGKEQQGRVEPVAVSERKGRRGLGHEPRNLELESVPDNLEWDINETIDIVETVEWINLPDEGLTMPDMATLRSWLKEGPKKLIIDDETDFVDKDILKYILICKSALDEIPDQELFRARSRSNPYESIKKGIFMNRAAMKMANIDTLLDFEITKPKTIYGEFVIGENDLLYFADICAGPGGFSEYVLWRKTWEAKGFGFTLKGDCDFKLTDFISGPPESFEPHYGSKGDGDIYNPENCQSFIEYVLKQSEEQGVHFVMADGGFSVAGQENIQEILSRQLYLSQAMVALSIIRKGGHFICKLFDVFTPFSVGLVYLMRFCFEKVALLKPNTSRPANSERYLICKWRKSDIKPVVDYLKECHEIMWSWKCQQLPKQKDILEIVPLNLLKWEDDPFFKYILDGNNSNGIRQVQNLRKIVSFWNDRNLQEDRQSDTRKKCLEYWKVPEYGRKRDMNMNPRDKFYEMLNRINCRDSSFEKRMDRELTPTLRANEFRYPYNWKFCPVENTMFKKLRGYFLSTGRSRIFRCDSSGNWEPLNSYVKFELSSDTLVYGEIVTEYEGTLPNQKKNLTFHIIDGLILGGKDIRGLSLTVRNECCSKFAKAMNKTYGVSGNGSVRAKEILPLEDYKDFHARLNYRKLIGGGASEKLICPVSSSQEESEDSDHILNSLVFKPEGILFLQETKVPWLVAISRSTGKKYFFDKSTGVNMYDAPTNASADFVLTMDNRLYWEWDKDVDLRYPREDQTDQGSRSKIHAQEIIDYIERIRTEGVK